MKKLVCAFLLIIGISDAFGQSQKDSLIQLSGILISGDTLQQVIPNGHVLVKNRNAGALTDREGFFSIVALRGDTIEFSYIGFKTEQFIVPDSLTENRYSIVMMLALDTLYLKEITLYPWPTPGRFNEEFLAMRIPTTELDLARRNLAIEELKARANELGFDAAMMQDYMINYQNSKLYNAGRYYGDNGGQAILSTLINPFAWRDLINSLSNDD